MHLRLVARGVVCDERGEADGLGAQIVAHEVFALVRAVAFVEEQVEHVENGVEPRGQLGRAGYHERHGALAQRALGAHEPLRDGRLGGEECAGNLRDAEAAQCLERQRYLGLARERRVAAGEHHTQLVVGQRAVEHLAGRLGGVGHVLQRGGQLVLLAVQGALAADDVQRMVPGHTHQPSRGIVGDAVVGPLAQRLEQRFLHDVFGQLQALGPEDTRQGGDHLPRLVAEQVVYEPRHIS